MIFAGVIAARRFWRRRPLRRLCARDHFTLLRAWVSGSAQEAEAEYPLSERSRPSRRRD